MTALDHGVRASRPHRTDVSPVRNTPPGETSRGCGRDARTPESQ